MSPSDQLAQAILDFIPVFTITLILGMIALALWLFVEWIRSKVGPIW